ncbi:MAG TPA: amino acid adenylation domain-containing protein [Ktedonosporobacter sp.]|nr:amino acid adenylation domain-containing protein [Ktedonosporobacter sp.]
MRLYKTGDLARYLVDGQVQFLGRSDTQVKLRGFRIELGEIEAILHAHPAVGEAVVVVREDEPGERRLVAYIIVNQKYAPIFRTLPADLKATLPSHMLPSAFVVLKEWPLTPNGKIDRRALPAPDSQSLAFLEAFVSPRTSCEKALAQIWCEMLHLDRVGIHDSFFMLGGHSLLATQIAVRIRSSLQVEVPLTILFTHSTIEDLASYIERNAIQRSPIPSIQRLPRGDNLPLSFSQERVWFLQQLEPTNMAYNAQAMLRLTGRLDVAALEASLSEIVRRHEIFRTTFPTVDGHPIQLIHRPQAVKLLLIDLKLETEQERELAIQHLMDEEFQKPFAITELPLVRWTLLRLSEKEHILLHVEHHLVHDGWSFTVFLYELQELYTAFAAGKPSSLPDLAIQFADFAQWQRQWMGGKEAEEQLVYWKQKLAGSPALLNLPTDRPRPAVLGFKGEVLRIELPVFLSEALRVCCRQEGVTLYMLLLGAFFTLLHRYTNQDDLCIGTGIANRRWQEAEPLIGMIINTLALRIDLSGRPTFQELLRRVREITLEAYAHQDLPFGKVVEALQPERSLSHSPLYQAAFSFHDSPLPSLNLPDLQVEVIEGLSNHSAKFDINIVVIPHAEQLIGTQTETEEKGITFLWEYNTDLFVAATIQRMAKYYQNLLQSISVNPKQRIDEIPLLTQEEQQHLLFAWNATTTHYPQDQCIHHLFEMRAEQTPDTVVAVDGDNHQTYDELNRRANQLSHYLQQQGVGPEVLVGICVERSLDMLAGLLGILKAGGAYVPLDPAYPKERLTYILQNSHICMLLSQQRFAEQLPSLQIRTFYLDADWQTIAHESADNPSSLVSSSNLAYVIYTSGSTGTPKGVLLQHEGLLNLVFWHQQAFLISSRDHATLVAAPAFDASVWELWPYLAVGACIYIPDEEIRISALQLRNWLIYNAITISFLPTPLAESILMLDWPDKLALRVLLTGGDVLHTYPSPSLPFVLVNNYGPTENTVVTTSGSVTSSEQASLLPFIGCPIANTQVYILDASLKPIPSGVPGELYVGGPSLARGYLHQADLTAERFIPNPFSKVPGARFYKTSDLTRYHSNGTIEFLRRIDQQVKIRGYRIELGEIEAVLSQHHALEDVVIQVREDVAEEKRLVAYFVPSQDCSPTSYELREFLKELLPDYMVPSAFIPLEKIPLLPNGKLDRQALPSPHQTDSGQEQTFETPRTTLELQLLQLFEDLLNVHPIGLNENFFELGGHSLLRVRLVMEIQKQFNQQIPLSALFKAATVEQLASVLWEQSYSRQRSPLVGLQPHGSKIPFYCVHPRGGEVLCYLDLARHIGSDQPFYAFEEPFLSDQEPSIRVEDLAERYIQALLDFQAQGPYCLGGWSLGGSIAFEMAYRLQQQGHEVALLVLLDTLAPSRMSKLADEDEAEAIAFLAEYLAGRFLNKFPNAQLPRLLSDAEVRLLTQQERLQYFLEFARAVNFVPPGTPIEVLHRYIQFDLAHLKAGQTYLPNVVYPGRITLLRVVDQINSTVADGGVTDLTLGWEEFTAQAVDVRVLLGTHVTMLEEPVVRRLAEQLKYCLEEVQQRYC